MELSAILSIAALGISAGSFGVAVWATRMSSRSLEHAIEVQHRSDQREFQRTRTDLLNQISDSRAVLDETRIEIGTLEANFRAESRGVQEFMANYVGVFSEYLPEMERAIRQCDELWADVSGWGDDKGYADLMRAKAVLYRSLKDDKSAQESGRYLVGVFKTKLELAKRQIPSEGQAAGS